MEQLPRGRHGLSREFIADNQKQRILAATAEILDERGYDGATVAAISGGAGVCAGLEATLAALAAQPEQANLLLVEGLRAGPELYGRFQRAVESFVPYLRDGAPAGKSAGRPPEAADEAVVGGIASLLGRRVLAGEADRLKRFFPELAEFALTPYLGIAEARRI